MAVTAYKYAGTASTVLYDPDTLGAGPDWTNPSNAAGSPDGSWATLGFSPLDSSVQKYSLRVSNFGFDSSDIPTSATIDGIEFVVTRKNVMTGTFQINDKYVFLVPAAGTTGQGDNLASASDWTTGSGEDFSYGGASELAGQSWTPADIFDSDFGLYLSPQRSGTTTMGSSSSASVDSVKVRIYFTAPEEAVLFRRSMSWRTGSRGRHV